MLPQLRSSGRRLLARWHDHSPHVLSRLRGRVLILAYHRVLPDYERQRQWVQPGLYVTPQVFETHVRFLRRHFRLMSVNEFVRRHDALDWNAEQRYCLITFDDGWLDNYEYAFPILRRHQAPATVFVPTALIGSQEWLWSEKLGWLLARPGVGGGSASTTGFRRAMEASPGWVARLERARTITQIDEAIESCKALPDGVITDVLTELAARTGVEFPKERRFLDWREVEEMSHAGITFGSHGVTHRILTRLSQAEIDAEVADSLATLQRRSVNWVPAFSYPNGDCNEAVVSAVRQAGYQLAVSTAPGADVCGTADPFRLRRVGIHNDISADLRLLAFHLYRVGRL